MVLTCEIHGFLLSTNPPTWQRGDDSFINSSSAKYSIKNGTTSQSSVLISNGTRVSGLRSTLTIRQLSGEDEGNYSCVADGASSSLELTVAAGTSPPPATSESILSSSSDVDIFRGCMSLQFCLNGIHFYMVNVNRGGNNTIFTCITVPFSSTRHSCIQCTLILLCLPCTI